MCGIAGWMGLPGGNRERLHRMCDALRHRGPDGAGLTFDGGVALGMRRLSIIDVEGGQQPISNEDGSVSVVFNGEIYNYRELRQSLERQGHTFTSRSDTEVLVHLYEERGPELVHALRGMFAFALWDNRKGVLFLARDRLGIKPLYYRPLDPGVVFASELKALQAAGLTGRDINPRALAAYLALGYVPDPLSIYSGVMKLPPGHLLTCRPGDRLEIRRYWAPPAESDPDIDEESAKREVRRLLEEAVRYRLRADVPLGAFLSGGLDSAAVVAAMSRQLDRPVLTFSVGFKDAAYNEAPDAAIVAKALGTDHTEITLDADARELIDEVVLAFDEPFADSSAIPMLLVSRLAAGRVKVALSGDGGDELFGGYTRYRDAHEARTRLPPPLGKKIAGAARLLPPGAYGRNRLLRLGRDEVGRYMTMVADPLEVGEGGVAAASTAAEVQPWNSLLQPAFLEAASRDPIGRLLHVDLLTYLPGDILTKVDRMSMAASLEARVPLLDHELVEFACRIPTELKFRDGRGKWIFREAVRELVPSSALMKRKQGFSVPLPQWFRGPLRGWIAELGTAASPLLDWLDRDALRRVVREHLTGRRDNSPLLWKVLVLDRWLSHHTVAPVDRPSIRAVV